MTHRSEPIDARRRATVRRHASALGRWELASGLPAEPLRPFVREYTGWDERVAAPLCRRELPTEEAPLVINFGEPFHLFTPGCAGRGRDLASFVTGAYDTYQLVESSGTSSGVQVNFTLLGLRLLVGRPIDDMTNRAVAPEDVFGPFVRDLTDRLHDAPSWDARFAWLDRALMAHMCRRASVPAGVLWAWDRLVGSQGNVPIAAVVREVGWSRRHFIAQFKHELGVSPKVLARMMRFGQVVRWLRAGRTTDLAGLALDAGYYDQSHLNRDVREFAGETPGALARNLLPDGGGFTV